MQKGTTMNASEVRLGQYADPEHTAYENVALFLADVERATLPEIVGATGCAWAGCHAAVHQLIDEGRVKIETVKPWEYVWKVK